MKNFLRNHIWMFLILVLALLFPLSLSNQAELNMRMIVTGVGIDYNDGTYKLTSQVVLPSTSAETSSANAELSQVETTGKTISEAVNALSFKLGKMPELSHMEYILIGKSMNQTHNIASSLDYFFRNFKLKNSIMVLAAENDAKDIIEKIAKLELSIALSMQKMYISCEQNLQGIAKNYVEFVTESFSKSGISVIDTLKIEEKQEESSDSSQQSQKSKPTIELVSPLYLYKKGAYCGKIEDKEQILGYYLVYPKSNSGNLQLKNLTFGEFQNANINLRLDSISKNLYVTFDGNIPTLNISININECYIDEIASSTINKNIYSSILDKNTKNQIVKAAKQNITEKIFACFENAKSQNIDIFEIANNAYIANKQKWQQYLDLLAEKDNYIKNLNINVMVNFNKIK